MCPWPSGPGVGLPNRTGGFDSRRALCRPAAVGDRRLFDKAADDWPGRQPADHPSSELGMLGVQLPPGPLTNALADQPGVVATFSPWRAGVQIPSRVLIAVSAGHWRAQVAVTHPHSLCRFNSCPTHCFDGLVAQPAEQDSLKVEVQGSTPCGATVRNLGVSSKSRHAAVRHPETMKMAAGC